MRRLLAVEDALRLVLERCPPPAESAEPSDLEYAIGCTLFEDVRADADHPAWPRSRVDGYAVRAADTPGTLAVAFEVPAGHAPGGRIAAGQAARVFTGAPVPDGADAVVMQEDVTARDGAVTLSERSDAGDHITPRGAECREGDLVAARGDVILPWTTGALAAVGKAKVRVARRPSVQVLATGSELVPIDQEPPPGRIRNSNAYALMAAMWHYAGWPEIAGMVPDTRPALDEALAAALAKDPAILLVSGGVSVGDYDLVPAALESAGVAKVFHGVSVQPGKPLWFGVRGKSLVFGLPGNPVSALVNSALFVRPAIRKMSGRTEIVPDPICATLTAPVGKGTWRRKYVPAKLSYSSDGRVVVAPVHYVGSGDLFGFARADALIVVREDAPARAAGESAQVVSLLGSGR
jgi:molybdopterin molybdotransferase